MKFRLIFILFSTFCLLGNQQKKQSQEIDLVFCIDLSSSTNGLIPVLKKHFWEIIYDFNRYYPEVSLKIGLIMYGRPSFDKKNNYIKVYSDLSSDYDMVFDSFSKLRTNVTQGEAWLDQAIDVTINQISWNEEAIQHAYFIGNGPAEGKNNASKTLVKKSIAKNNLHFNFMFYNSYNNQKDKDGWKELAEMGKGNYKLLKLEPSSIQFQKKYDMEWITDIGNMINDSYLPYGSKGYERLKISLDIDSICATIDEDCYESRMIYKASRFYQNMNASWDLIDLFTTQPMNVEVIQESEVAPTLKSMKESDLIKYLQLKKLDRKQLLAEMARHSAKRDLFLYKKHAKLKLFNQQTYFYEALISSLESGLSSDFKITY